MTNLAPATHSIASVNIAGGALVGIAALLAIGRAIALCRTIGLDQCDLGLRLCRAVSANAIYRIIFRPAVDRHFRFAACRHAGSVTAPHGLVSDGGQSRYGDSRSVSGIHLSAVVPRDRPLTCCVTSTAAARQVQLYILYIAVTLLLLLLWQLA